MRFFGSRRMLTFRTKYIAGNECNWDCHSFDMETKALQCVPSSSSTQLLNLGDFRGDCLEVMRQGEKGPSGGFQNVGDIHLVPLTFGGSGEQWRELCRVVSDYLKWGDVARISVEALECMALLRLYLLFASFFNSHLHLLGFSACKYSTNIRLKLCRKKYPSGSIDVV